MGASLNELFGDAAAQSAADGKYGLRPSGYRLPDATRIRAVTLQVSDLSRSRDFYEHTLGLTPLKVEAAMVTLGAADSSKPLVTLIENRAGASRTSKQSLGLYHVAILLPTRGDLGRFLRHLEHIGVRAGAGDHLVSEALYLQDPDNLGIEIYADRPRETWQRLGQELMIATDPVDVAGLVAAAGDTPWTGMPAGTVIGHVHLHVAELAQGSAFFSEALGFDRMTWRYPGALFLGAGGYHHHLGTNTWAGAGARPPEDQDARLLEWTIEVPTADDVAAVARNVTSAGHVADVIAPGEVLTRDPWGTAVRVRAGSEVTR